jgi:hypothetical protein
MGCRVVNSGLHVFDGLVDARDCSFAIAAFIRQGRIKLGAGYLEIPQGRFHVGLTPPSAAHAHAALTAGAAGRPRGRNRGGGLGNEKAAARDGRNGKGGKNMFVMIFHNGLLLMVDG